MKRLLSVVLALSLAGTSAAFAKGHPAPDYRGSGHYGYSQNDRGHSRDNTVAAVGLGLFALGVIGIIASQQHDRDYGYYAPPPSYGYGGYGSQGYQGNPYGNSGGYRAYNGYGPSPYGYGR